MHVKLLTIAIVCGFVSCQQRSQPGDLESTCCESYCLSTDNEIQQVKQFSTKTAYDFVREKNDQKYYNVPSTYTH